MKTQYFSSIVALSFVSSLALAGGGTVTPRPPVGANPPGVSAPSCGATIDGTNLHAACFSEAVGPGLECDAPSPEFQGASPVFGSGSGTTDQLNIRQIVIRQNQGSSCVCLSAGKTFTSVQLGLVKAQQIVAGPFAPVSGVFYGTVSSLTRVDSLDLSAPAIEIRQLDTTGGTRFDLHRLQIQGGIALLDVDARVGGSTQATNFTRTLRCR